MSLQQPRAQPHHSQMTRHDHLPHSSLTCAFLSPLSLQTHSVGKVAQLMKFEQDVVRDVKCGEANPHSNGAFKPVHAQSFVQSTHDALPGHNLTHGPENCAVR